MIKDVFNFTGYDDDNSFSANLHDAALLYAQVCYFWNSIFFLIFFNDQIGCNIVCNFVYPTMILDYHKQ